MDKHILQEIGMARLTIGLDLGDRESTYVIVDSAGRLVARSRVGTTRREMGDRFLRLPPSLIALETGTHSAWVSSLLEGMGHEVVVANARELALISRSSRKSDRRDAEQLARLARADRKLLRPIHHRSIEAREALAFIRTRAMLVETRTKWVNHVQGSVKATGTRLPAKSAPAFHRRSMEEIPPGLRRGLLPLLEDLRRLTERIAEMDREIERIAAEEFPEAEKLMTVPGVGALTALTYVLTLEDPGRFRRSREVAAYLGLVPRRHSSGDSDPQLSITKEGDAYLRDLLVQAAHWTLGPFGKESELREWGLRKAGEGDSRQKRRAVIAVARRLSTILFHLWRTGETYEPFPGRKEATAVS